MSNDTHEDLQIKSFLEVLLPTVAGAQIVSILIGLGIGLFSSRKTAVPIYKFEKWVQQLKSGNLNTELSFREDEEMHDLTLECNELAGYYKSIFEDLHKTVDALEKTPSSSDAALKVAELRKILGKVSFD